MFVFDHLLKFIVPIQLLIMKIEEIAALGEKSGNFDLKYEKENFI